MAAPSLVMPTTFNKLRIVVEMELAYLEILDTTKRLNAIKDIFRNLDIAEQVGLDTEFFLTIVFHVLSKF